MTSDTEAGAPIGAGNPASRERSPEPAEVTVSSGNVFRDLQLPHPEVLRAEAEARLAVGIDAKPTGKLCFDRRTRRLLHEWRGSFGSIWLEVPAERAADALPGDDEEPF